MLTGRATSKNKVLQRIYGVCFPTPEELEASSEAVWKKQRKETIRKIGKDMNLFMVDDLVGRGLPMFLTKGLYDLAGA